MGVIRPQPLQSSYDSVDNMTTEQEVDCGCTCMNQKLFRNLSRFAKPSVFIAVLIVFAVVLGAVQGFFTAHYQANSINASLNVIDWLLMGSQLVQALIVVPIAYVGGRRNRPAWLAFLAGSVVVFCLIFGSLILSEYGNQPVTVTYSLKQDPTLCVKFSERVLRDDKNYDWLSLTTICLLHLCLGITSVCFFALAITYIDDNVDMVNSPGIIGIVLGFQQLGPLLGMMLGWLCSSTIVTGILWIVLAVVLLVVTVMIGMFPRSLLDNEGGLASNSIYYTKNKGFFGSFLRVVTNRIFMLLTLGLAFMWTAMLNFGFLLTRYEESVYYASQANGFNDPWTARMIITFVRPVLVGVVIIASGIFMYRFEPSPTRLATWTVAALFCAALIFFANIFLTCSSVHLTTESKNRLDLTMYCNKDCQCREDLAFTPVYAKTARLVYFSPCHAGCTSAYYSGHEKVFRNCSCVPTESVVSGVHDQGKCQLYGLLFECLTVLSAVLVASTIVGLLMLSFRVVLTCDKPMMIAMQMTIVSLLATLPGRQLFLIVARLSCIVSGTDECRLHEARSFVTYINITTIVFLFLAVAIFAVSNFLVRNVVLYGDLDHVSKKATVLTEMKDMRTRKSNGKEKKDRRHSFHGEDQRLLDTDRPPVVVQRAPSISLDNEHRLSTYEGQMQKAASYSEELNKLLQTPAPVQTSMSRNTLEVPAPTSGNTLQVPTPGMTVRKDGMLTTLL